MAGFIYVVNILTKVTPAKPSSHPPLLSLGTAAPNYFYLMVALIIFLVSILTILAVHADGNVTCSGTGLNWYTNFVGESPCKTYERLRQICNPAFEVGVMSTNTSTPPDVCNEQLADCCCNSIAFALAMLCLKFVPPCPSSGYLWPSAKE
ncbi:hypothetical protein BDP27DRAFT_900571 [Rhodocollybia butyracea]|uniref:Uncharacterized protein n=1 Tax=Rhodocollybia butyracea TaxID=206335 RepID=A0A9P5PQQ0_9AGAR|nr:hypothetical protein BDP27DRAFT_900571 [Rhodocollybia butyracea]